MATCSPDGTAPDALWPRPVVGLDLLANVLEKVAFCSFENAQETSHIRQVSEGRQLWDEGLHSTLPGLQTQRVKG